MAGCSEIVDIKSSSHSANNCSENCPHDDRADDLNDTGKFCSSGETGADAEAGVQKEQPLVMSSCDATESCIVAGDATESCVVAGDSHIGNATSDPAALIRYGKDAETSISGISASDLEHSKKEVGCLSETNSPVVVKRLLNKEHGRTAVRAKDVESESGRSCSPRKGCKSPMEKKKKGTAWYSERLLLRKKVLNPTYKSRSDEFKRFFKGIPLSERLIADYSCALQKDILVHGRLYIGQSFLCFYANIFRWATVLEISFKDVVKLTKERTAKVIPNAIQVITNDDRFFFTSFGARDKMFLVLENVWKTCANNQVLKRCEMWLWIHYSYGEELGLTSGEEEDYYPLSTEDRIQFHLRLPKLDKPNQNADNPATLDTSKEPEDDYLLVSGPDSRNKLAVPSLSPGESSLVNGVTFESEISNQHLSKSLNGAPNVDGQGSFLPSQPRNCSKRMPSLLGASTNLNSDDEEAVDHCSQHDHFPIHVIDEILNIPVETVFAHCFTDSPLYQEFVTAKKTFDVVLSSWPAEADASGTKVRNIAYTLSLNYAIGPKVSPSTERQIMYPESRPGQFYLIDTECINGGIPYGENFYVVNRYCISKISNTRCRLRITSQIKYRKSVWGFVKNFIEKNASAGIIDSFNILAELLRQESNSQLTDLAMNVQPTCSLARKRVLRRKRASGRTSSKNVSPDGQVLLNSTSRQANPTRHSLLKAILAKLHEEWHMQLTFDVVVRVICIVLVLLVIFNAILFSKLWSLESSTLTLVSSRLHQYDASGVSETPKSSQEWLKLLDHQRLLHDSEIAQWKEILSTSIQLLDQMTHTLAELRSSLDQRPVYKRDRTSDGAIPS